MTGISSIENPTQGRTARAFVGGRNVLVATIAAILFASVASAADVAGTARLIRERRSHTATSIGGGKILVAGGQNLSGPLADVEIFDATTGTFTVAARLLTPRAEHTATRLADRRVFLIGGRGGEPLTSTEFYDATRNVFSAGPSLNSPRFGHTATLLPDGRVVVIGGNADGTAEIFDPRAGTFTALPCHLAEPRSFHAAVRLFDGTILVAGGISRDGVTLKSAEILHPDTFECEPVATMHAARSHFVLRLLPDGKVQAIGGDAERTMELFNPAGYFSSLGHLAGTASSESAALRNPGRVAILGPAARPISDTTATDVSDRETIRPVQSLLDRLDYSMTEVPEAGIAIATGGVSSAGRYQQTAVLFDASAATVTTDKTDYAPGETVVITGTGWLPGETVTLNIHRDTNTPPDTVLTAVANANGNITNSEYVVQDYDLGVTFLLTATGQTSGYTAQTTFTDSRIITNVTLNGGSSLTVAPGATITAVLSVTTDNGGGNQNWRSSSWRIATTPPGTTTCVNHADHDGSGNYTDTITITAPAVAGTYNAYFLAHRDDVCTAAQQSNLFTLTNGVIVTAPPVVDLNGGAAGIDYAATFTEDGGPTAIVDSANLTVTDADSTNLTSGTVTLTNILNPALETLAVNTTGTPVVASYDSGTGVLSLTGTATLSQYQQVLRTTTYNNTSQNPSTTNRIVTFVVNDGAFNSATATSTVTVNSVNDAPVNTVPGAQTTNEDVVLVLSAGNGNAISISDADAGTNAVQVQLAATNGTLTLSGTTGLTFTVGDGTADASMTFTGTIANINTALNGTNYVPTANFNGSANLSITTNDQGNTGSGGPQSDSDSVAITVAAVNDAPSFTKGADQTFNEDSGAHTVSPWATAISAGPANENTQTVTFTATNDNNALFTVQPSVASDGTLTFTSAPNAFGSATVTATLKDDGGTANGGVDTSAPQTFTITINAVNDEPSFTKGGDDTVLEDSGARSVPGWATAISAGPANESGQVVSFIVTANTNTPLFSAGPAVSSTGTLTYTPAPNAKGSATITLKAKDNGGTANGGVDESPTQSFVINVTAVNDEPSFTKGADQTVNEDSGAHNVPGWATAISAGPADESAQTLTFTATNDNNALFSAQPSVATDGTLTYTLAADAFGLATVTVTLHDNGGTANGGVDASAPQTFTITINAVNDAPSFAKGGDQTVNEDSGPHSVSGWATAISAGPANESGQTVSFIITNNTNPGLFSAGPAVSSTGTLTYSLTADAFGTATITLKAKDDGGTANGGVDESPTQSFTITVNSVNDAPTFTPGVNETVNEDAGAQTVPGWATNMSAGPANESQTLSFTTTNNNNGLFSTQPSVAADGTLTYTPAANEFGSATVTVRLTDNGGTDNGGVDFTEHTFTITVNAVNDEPSFAKGADQTVNEDSGPHSVSGWATAISAGANESGQTLTFQLSNDNTSLFSAQPAVAADGTLTYTPAANANGSATVTVYLMDDGGTDNGGDDTSPSQTFTITVTAVNDAPTFTKGADQTVAEDSGPHTVSAWASAMSAGPPDESGQTPSFSTTNNNNALFSAQPSVAPDGTLTYTSAPNAYGSATVTVRLSDNGGTANGGVDHTEQTFTITVTPVNDAPANVTVAATPSSLSENQSATLNGSFTDPDSGDSHTVVISWGDGSLNSTVTLVPGVQTFSTSHSYLDDKPTATASDTNTISVTVTDNGTPPLNGAGGTNITVNNVAPVVTSVTGPAGPQQIGTPVTITATFTDVGTQDTHKCSFNWDETPPQTTDNVPATETNGSGSCSASHSYASPGVYTIVVTVMDDDTGSASRTYDLDFVVIFDPNGGFVTGGGWIDSPSGASLYYPTAVGKANFGFVSKYKKGSNAVLEGETEFQFKAGDLNFHSLAYDPGTLVISGHKAQYKGTGTINGSGNYKFILTAYDGDLMPTKGPDKFRMKITDSTGTAVYDNRQGASDDIDAADPQVISGGSIVIHKGK